MNEIVKQYKAIKREYAYDGDIMTKDDPRVARLKYIIEKCLPTVDRTIILLYADCQSYRELGKVMHLSHMTARKECLRIRKKILDEYERLFNHNADGPGGGVRC